MLIDWFTVGAQLLNFLILVALLKRFLYRPILDAIDAREQRIAGELAQADAAKAEAERERDAFAQKNAEFDRLRAASSRQVATSPPVPPAPRAGLPSHSANCSGRLPRCCARSFARPMATRLP